jgi:excisionase family DNA binding protein
MTVSIASPAPSAPTATRSAPTTADRPVAYRVEDFCRAYGIGRSTVYELIKEKELKSAVIAGRRVIPASEGDRLLTEALAKSA